MHVWVLFKALNRTPPEHASTVHVPCYCQLSTAALLWVDVLLLSLLPYAPPSPLQQEVDGIRGLHASLFSSSTGELKALDLAPDLSDTLWAAFMVNSRSFSDAAGREMLSLMV